MSTISSRIADLIEDALERGVAQGEDLEYDVTLLAIPGQGGQPQPMIGAAFTLSAVQIGAGHAVMFLMPPAVPDQEAVDDLVRRVVQGLIQTRSQVVAQEMQAAATSNGHKDIPGHVSKSGLILPGQ